MKWYLGMTLEESEKKIIMSCLNHFGGNKTQAAASLGISVRTLYNKLESYGQSDKNISGSSDEPALPRGSREVSKEIV